MHYGANPLAKGTLAQFMGFMKNPQIQVHPLQPGDVASFSTTQGQ